MNLPALSRQPARRTLSLEALLAMPIPSPGIRGRMSGKRVYQDADPAALDRIEKLVKVLRSNASEGERENAGFAMEKVCAQHGLMMEEWGVTKSISEEEMARITHYIDAEYEAGNTSVSNGWRPSDLLMIGECAIGTVFMANVGTLSQSDLKAACFQRTMIGRARALYRDGYFANPFTKTPNKRPNA